jgi:hypothetical protein
MPYSPSISKTNPLEDFVGLGRWKARNLPGAAQGCFSIVLTGRPQQRLFQAKRRPAGDARIRSIMGSEQGNLLAA